MTAPARFLSDRAGGRSDARVIADLVRSAEPGRVFTYHELTMALALGTNREITRETVRGAVGRAYALLLREQSRTLDNVPNVGYRVAAATDHQQLAKRRKRRSDVQLRRGVQVLQHVRWDELDPLSRAAHEGTLLIMSAVYENQRALEKRQDRVEAALRAMAEKSGEAA